MATRATLWCMAYGVATGRKAADGQAHLPFPVIVRVRVAPRAVHHLDGRQQRVHAARHDALGGAAAAHDGDAAQPVVDAAQQQRLPFVSGSALGSGIGSGFDENVVARKAEAQHHSTRTHTRK